MLVSRFQKRKSCTVNISEWGSSDCSCGQFRDGLSYHLDATVALKIEKNSLTLVSEKILFWLRHTFQFEISPLLLCCLLDHSFYWERINWGRFLTPALSEHYFTCVSQFSCLNTRKNKSPQYSALSTCLMWAVHVGTIFFLYLKL